MYITYDTFSNVILAPLTIYFKHSNDLMSILMLNKEIRIKLLIILNNTNYTKNIVFKINNNIINNYFINIVKIVKFKPYLKDTTQITKNIIRIHKSLYKINISNIILNNSNINCLEHAKEIYLNCCIIEELYYHFYKYIPNVKKMVITDVEIYGDYIFNINKCKNLTELSLIFYETNIDINDFKELDLIELTIDVCYLIDNQFKNISCFKNLKSLFVNTNSIYYIDDIKILYQLEKVEIFNLYIENDINLYNLINNGLIVELIENEYMEPVYNVYK